MSDIDGDGDSSSSNDCCSALEDGDIKVVPALGMIVGIAILLNLFVGFVVVPVVVENHVDDPINEFGVTCADSIDGYMLSTGRSRFFQLNSTIYDNTTTVVPYGALPLHSGDHNVYRQYMVEMLVSLAATIVCVVVSVLVFSRDSRLIISGCTIVFLQLGCITQVVLDSLILADLQDNKYQYCRGSMSFLILQGYAAFYLAASVLMLPGSIITVSIVNRY